MTWIHASCRYKFRIHTGWRLEYMKVADTSLEYIQVEDLTQFKNANNLLSLGYIQVAELA